MTHQTGTCADELTGSSRSYHYAAYASRVEDCNAYVGYFKLFEVEPDGYFCEQRPIAKGSGQSHHTTAAGALKDAAGAAARLVSTMPRPGELGAHRDTFLRGLLSLHRQASQLCLDDASYADDPCDAGQYGSHRSSTSPAASAQPTR